MNLILKKFRHDIFAISFLGLACFFALALASFNPIDPSLNSLGQGLRASNHCGLVGSFLADLLYQFFGVTAWLIVAGFLKVAYAGFRREELDLKNIRFIWGLLLVINLSSILSLYLPEKRVFANQIYLGGLLGLGVSQALLRAFNYVGVQVVLWSLSAVLVVFYSERTVKELFGWPRDILRAFAAWGPAIRLSKRAIEFAGIGKKKITKSKIEEAPNKRFFNMKNEDFVESSAQGDETSKPRPKGVTSAFGESQNTDEFFFDDEAPAIKAQTKRKVILKTKVPQKVANWQMPKLSLLEDPPATRIKIDEKEIRRKAELLVDKLKQFNVEGQIVAIKPGPAVTMFEFKPNVDVKLSKITELADDLSLALSSESLRIIAPIPGRDVVGIETSNAQRETVYLKDLLAEDNFWSEEVKLPISLGKQANGEPKIVDLRKMPHLLVAGTTGSGKSVFTVSSITGMLFKHSPKTLRLILVDPKQVDLAAFSSVPHLIMPPVTDPKKAVSALRWAVKEMEKRNKSMSKFGARKLEEFNEIVGNLAADKIAEHEKLNQELENQGIAKLEQYYYTPQPYIMIVVEEFADLMAVDKVNVEQTIIRLAQMARACGIHLMLAMQSPRKEVVTGLIKTNIPGRISFKVAGKMDSRIILDEMGAERLLANGDMLFLAPGVSKPMRHHGPFLKDSEINAVAKFWSDQAAPEFDPLAMKALDGFAGGSAGEDGDVGGGDGFGDQEHDERYDEILSWAADQKEVSASLIQRKFRLGYPRAARIIEIFEKEGVVGPANGSKPRQVLVNSLRE
ncbi:MAG: DNA translocase FtsK 4TM domain-containing protein [Bdellovibrionaceae bacterium]|nr:DNA translocase FtsK 4TM domain-containing protein [Pseudobdellovibrionaceae bacterium]